MGKGDKKTRRGKIFSGSYGRKRPRKNTIQTSSVKVTKKKAGSKVKPAVKENVASPTTVVEAPPVEEKAPAKTEAEKAEAKPESVKAEAKAEKEEKKSAAQAKTEKPKAEKAAPKKASTAAKKETVTEASPESEEVKKEKK